MYIIKEVLLLDTYAGIIKKIEQELRGRGVQRIFKQELEEMAQGDTILLSQLVRLARRLSIEIVGFSPAPHTN